MNYGQMLLSKVIDNNDVVALKRFGVEEFHFATEGERGDIHAIINYRVTNGLPTVYTSNFPIEDMARIFDERLYDRMRDMCAVVEFTDESKRGKRRG